MDVRRWLVLWAVVAGVVLAACGGESGTSTGTPTASSTATVSVTAQTATVTASESPPPTATVSATATPPTETATATATATPTVPPTPTETATEPPTPTEPPTETPTEVTVPERPASFDDYPERIATYLAAGGGANDCLAGLFVAWEMAVVSGEACATADFNHDGAAHEFAVFLTDPTALDFGAAGALYVFEANPGGFEPVRLDDVYSGFDGSEAGILVAEDMTGDGLAELAAQRTSCGASTCQSEVLIYTYEAGSYRLLADPPPGITFATVEFAPADDGTVHLFLTGGTEGSVGAGPTRERVEEWGYSNLTGNFETFNVTPLPSEYLFHLITDADLLFAQGLASVPTGGGGQDLADAEALYQQALTDTTLTDWHEAIGNGTDIDLLGAYVLIKLARIKQVTQQPGTGDMLLEQAAGEYAGTFFGEAALLLRDTGNCDDLTAFIEADPDAYAAAWDFGYANPAPEPLAVCGIVG